MSRWELPRGDEGSAIIEFIGVSLVLLVPLVYLVLVLGKIEAATFAVEGAAREAARVYVRSDSADEGSRAAVASVGIALQDQGFTDDPAGALTVVCSEDPCLTPGGDVEADVEISVPLPFVPGFVRDAVPLAVPVSATRSAPVDEYRAGG
ncbi:TadE/TadG family type IV pilus assembly protein [Cellulomonas sp. PhB150]|uniref:TadE/TadG family type IV pilus assembly protein n=1 Tax=Cellulomonas sp. PhB150 TaxID=2485188 RepID=UPI000F467A6C|nr:TadE/TadG family type IV pilus assembly protein [Cellulomonas sp. PhB150]ROS27810.1 TadE-like protein [Cellulomonas sp. PhB150]